MKLLFAFCLLSWLALAIAQNVEIYEYKNANGVTVFTNKPDKVKNGAKLAPLAAMQIYSGPALNKLHNKTNGGGVAESKENLPLNNESRKQILAQEYQREIKLLKETQDQLAALKLKKITDKQQLQEVTDNIAQHKDNIEILRSQINK